MLSNDPYPGRKYEVVLDRDTGEAVVLPLKDTVLDQSAVFYDAARHQHLTCFDCKQPDIIVIDAFTQSGGKKIGQHFKIAHGQSHKTDCERDIVVVDIEHTERDQTKGPVIFLNPSWRDLTSHFKKVAEGVTVDHLMYVDEAGKQRIRNADLETRPRRQAKDMEGMLAVMTSKTMTQTLLNDSWIIRGDTATPWQKFFIRGSRWIEFAQDMIDPHATRHPVMLHMHMRKPAKYEIKDNKPRLRLDLQPYVVQDRETGEDVTIHPHMYVRDQRLFAEFTTLKRGEDRELFIIATPYLSDRPARDPKAPRLQYISDAEAARPVPVGPRHVHVHFDVVPHLYAQQNLHELSRKMTERPSFTGQATPVNDPAPV